jgi:hypothetical protein
MESFFEFSFWISEELQDLISEHELREANAAAASNDLSRNENMPSTK